MTEHQPTPQQWRNLYACAIHINKLAPWEWMTETDIFGVQAPETGEIGFVSVMGMAGEHYAVSVYRGPQGLYGFWDLQHMPPFESPQRLLEIPQLSLSFENRELLDKPDRAMIKKLGLKFRGQHAWPLFRSMHPGFHPWYLQAAETVFLGHVLEQTLELAPRYQQDRALLDFADEQSYRVRVAHEEKGRLIWEDRILQIAPPAPSSLAIDTDAREIDELSQFPLSANVFEADFFMLPTMIGEQGARPSNAYMLLIVDVQSQMVVGHELLIVESSLEAMWSHIPSVIAHQLASAGLVPGEIQVRSPLLFQLLQPLADKVGFSLSHSETLATLDAVKQSLAQFMM